MLLLVLDNFSLVQRCFVIVSWKHANSLKISNLPFDLEISWPRNMHVIDSLDCSRG